MTEKKINIHNLTIPVIDLLLSAVINLFCYALGSSGFSQEKTSWIVCSLAVTALVFFLRFILGVYRNPELPFNKLAVLKNLLSDGAGIICSCLISINLDSDIHKKFMVLFTVAFMAVSLFIRLVYKRILSQKVNGADTSSMQNSSEDYSQKNLSQEQKISVIIATYRRSETLKKAIDSVLTQDYKNYEIIVVDDNADEEWNRKVKAIIENYTELCEDGRLTLLVNKENLGSAKARNEGIYAAKGEYITFLDDDDVYLPQKLSHQISGMLSSGADFSITDLNLYDENENLHDERIRKNLVSFEKNELLKYHLMYHLTGTDSLMFSSEYIRKIGAFPPINIGDEFYLMLQAILGGGRLCYIKGCHIKAYIHSGDGGLSSGQRKIDGERELYRYKQQFFSELDNKSKRYIKMRHHAVVAFAYLRISDYFHFVKEGVKAVASAPLESVQLLRNL